MGIIDKSKLQPRTGAVYPAPFDAMMAGRSSLRLGHAGGLSQFGVNEVILAPGAMSSLRHWHEREDEFVMVLTGECTLVQDAGETPMRPGDCAAFPAGTPDGHHFINKTAQEARFLVIGSKMPREHATYSDVDLLADMNDGAITFTHKDGTPYTGETT
jgi:uncharacterized cupin superfamily protein